MPGVINFAKVTQLPSLLLPSTVYLVEGSTNDRVNIYITSKDAISVRHVVTMDEVLTLIANAVDQIPQPFQFHQQVPAKDWIIPNPFPFRPLVIVTDSAGDYVETDIQWDMDNKRIIVSSSSEFSGTADIG